MTVLLQDDCEDFAAWAVGGSPSIVPALHGNGFSLPTGGSNFLNYNIATGDQTDTITFGANVRFSALSASAATFMAWRSDAGLTSHVELRVDSAGTLRLFRGTATLLVASAAGVIVVNAWNYLEATVKLHDTTGAVTLRVNGAVVASATNIDTKAGGTKTVFDQLRIRADASHALIVDDIYIRSDSTFGVGVMVDVWNGAAFVDAPAKVWSGAAFADAVAIKTWNGSAFV